MNLYVYVINHEYFDVGLIPLRKYIRNRISVDEPINHFSQDVGLILQKSSEAREYLTKQSISSWPGVADEEPLLMLLPNQKGTVEIAYVWRLDNKGVVIVSPVELPWMKEIGEEDESEMIDPLIPDELESA